MRVGAFTVVAALAICVGMIVDTELTLPITAYGLAFAVAYLAYYWIIVGLKPYHWVVLGGFGLVSVAPIWGGIDDKISLVMIPTGVATILVGLFDHGDLVRSIRRVRSAATVG